MKKLIDQYLKEGKMEKAYSLINKYFAVKKIKGNTIEDENGRLLFDEREIVRRWKRYIEQLYHDDENIVELDEENETEEGHITREEFNVALKHLKDKKACGKDDLPADLLKALEIRPRNARNTVRHYWRDI